MASTFKSAGNTDNLNSPLFDVDRFYDGVFLWLDCLVDSWLKRLSLHYGDVTVRVPRWLVLMILVGLMMAVG
jgi:hypothetical protein